MKTHNFVLSVNFTINQKIKTKNKNKPSIHYFEYCKTGGLGVCWCTQTLFLATEIANFEQRLRFIQRASSVTPLHLLGCHLSVIEVAAMTRHPGSPLNLNWCSLGGVTRLESPQTLLKGRRWNPTLRSQGTLKQLLSPLLLVSTGVTRRVGMAGELRVPRGSALQPPAL